VLPRRAARLKAGSLIFQDLALERWAEAHALHSKAMRSRSPRAFHNLRIGIKRFRYLVENFLPAQHGAWKDDLKQVQDLLGEVHDLDILWTTALKVGAFSDPGARSRWQARIIEEQSSRLAEYSRKMTGKASLWQVWRSQLPKGRQIASAGLSRLRVWASFRDPYVKHSAHVARLALQLYDGLIHNGHSAGSLSQNRALLRVAALLHHVGMSKSQKGFHKISYRLIRDMRLPHGWSPTDLQMAAVVARYHRGVLPRAGQKELKALTASQRQNARFLTGILRLANAFDVRRDGRIRRLEVRERNGFLVVAAEGYSAHDRIGAEVAAARHLLETVFRRPVIVRSLRPLKTAQQPRVKSRGNQ
jgi:CHAD domain/HD domain